MSTLPPLPESKRHAWDAAYSSDQMREYARAAVLAEREACIDIVARNGGSIEIEAAIRRRGVSLSARTVPEMIDSIFGVEKK